MCDNPGASRPVSKAQTPLQPARTKSMGIWHFWESYQQALDKHLDRGLQGGVGTPSLLDREMVKQKISRFLSAVRKMPKAWSAKPWTSREMNQARNNVANDLYRKRITRDLGLR